jgi:presenilin-like A22 family membrane protease
LSAAASGGVNEALVLFRTELANQPSQPSARLTLSVTLETLMKASSPVFHRCFTAIIGLVIGGLVGMLALYFVMFVVGSDFGLDNVRPGAVVGAFIGFFLGLWFPHRWSWLDFMGP